MDSARLTRLSNRGPWSTSGFTYIGLLIFIALMGIGLALAGQVWHTAMQREKEKELLFVGDQFRTAIIKYYEGSPGGVKKFPKSLEELLDDRRYPATKRHLRKIFRDPMTGEAQWGLVESPAGGIMGVYSLSKGEPRKIAGFLVRDEAFTDATSYADWKFGYTATANAEIDAGAAAAPVPGATMAPLPGTTLVPLPGANPTQLPGTAPAPLPGAAPAPVPGAVPTPVPGAPPVAGTSNGLTPGGQTAPPSPPPALTDASKEEANLKRTCENFLRTDRDNCANVDSPDDADAGTRCDQSATARNEACMAGMPMPPLDIPIATKP